MPPDKKVLRCQKESSDKRLEQYCSGNLVSVHPGKTDADYCPNCKKASGYWIGSSHVNVVSYRQLSFVEH